MAFDITLMSRIAAAIVTGSDVSKVLEENMSKAPQQLQDALRKHFVRSELIDLDYSSRFYWVLPIFAGFPPPPAFRIRLEETLLKYLFGSGSTDFNLIKLVLSPYILINRLLSRLSLSFLSYVGTFYYPMAPLFENIGIRDEKLSKPLSVHSGRSSRWLSLVFLVYFILIALLISVIWLMVQSLFRGAIPNQLPFADNPVLRSVVVFLMLLSIFLLMTVPFRLAFRLINGQFAETICVREILHLLLDLHKDDLLINPSRRKTLQSRIDYLAKANALLASRRYASSNRETQNWIEQHFRAIEEFIRERERWIVVPMEGTPTALKADFSNLAQIYLCGDYGRFVWQKPSYAEVTEPASWLKRTGQGLIRFLGFALPLVLMGFYLWRRDLFPFIKADLSGPITYLFIGWLLLMIDITFSLGVVSELTKTAKGIKELIP